jgi:hypothetical protein
MRLTRRGRAVLEWLLVLLILGISIFGEGVYDALIH